VILNPVCASGFHLPPNPPTEKAHTMNAPITNATPEEESLLSGGSVNPTPNERPKAQGIPEWANVPADLNVPKGRQVGFIRLRGAWTDSPEKGDRVLIVWPLSPLDERNAMSRTNGDGMRTLPEYTKQMIRCIDEEPVNWANGPMQVDRLWSEMGARCRQLLINYYLKTHSLSDEETLDFFNNCISVLTAGLR